MTTSPGTSSDAGMLLQTPSRRTEADKASLRLQGRERGLRPPFVKKPQSGVEDQKDRDDGSLHILSKHN